MKIKLLPPEPEKNSSPIHSLSNKNESKKIKIQFIRGALIFMLFVCFFFIINCSKTNTQNFIDKDLSFSEVNFNPKDKPNDLVLIGFKTEDTVIFSIDKKRILQGLMDDKSYKYFFDDKTVFSFLIDSIQPFYSNTDHVYLYARGLANTQIGNEQIKFVVAYELVPDGQNNLYNLYTTAHLCRTTDCNSCVVLRDFGLVTGCDCRNAGTCTHEIATTDKGDYFILPIKK